MTQFSVFGSTFQCKSPINFLFQLHHRLALICIWLAFYFSKPPIQLSVNVNKHCEGFFDNSDGATQHNTCLNNSACKTLFSHFLIEIIIFKWFHVYKQPPISKLKWRLGRYFPRQNNKWYGFRGVREFRGEIENSAAWRLILRSAEKRDPC